MTDEYFVTAKQCSDITGAPPCCDSCHEDEAMGYPMIELHAGWNDPFDAILCCAVWRYVTDAHV